MQTLTSNSFISVTDAPGKSPDYYVISSDRYLLLKNDARLRLRDALNTIVMTQGFYVHDTLFHTARKAWSVLIDVQDQRGTFSEQHDIEFIHAALIAVGFDRATSVATVRRSDNRYLIRFFY